MNSPPPGQWTLLHEAPNGVETWERRRALPPAWRQLIQDMAGQPGRPAQPSWDQAGPWCDERCQHHDGKRCELLGFRPSRLCEPVVRAMVASLDVAAGETGGQGVAPP